MYGFCFCKKLETWRVDGFKSILQAANPKLNVYHAGAKVLFHKTYSQLTIIKANLVRPLFVSLSGFYSRITRPEPSHPSNIAQDRVLPPAKRFQTLSQSQS